MTRVLGHDLTVVALVLAIAGCEKKSEPIIVPSPTVRTDSAGLAEKVELPPGVVTARWIVEPLSRSTVPGPTDVRLYAYLSIAPSSWSAVEDRLGPPGKKQGAPLPEAIATAHLPPTVLAKALRGEDTRVVQGLGFRAAPLERAFFRADLALRVDDAMLLILTTR